MSKLKSKLAQISEKQEKLQAEYKAAVAERKQKIGAIAERCKILEESDAFFAGLFLEAAKKVNEDKTYIKNLEALGSSFLNSKRKNAIKDSVAEN